MGIARYSLDLITTYIQILEVDITLICLVPAISSGRVVEDLHATRLSDMVINNTRGIWIHPL